MRVLLSAYACEPNQGSESELGWKKLLDLAPQCTELTVVTRGRSQGPAEEAMARLNWHHVRFIYYDLPKWLNGWRYTREGAPVHVYAWEIGLFFFLRARYRKNAFDLAHKITVSSYRYPNFSWYFARRFSTGPLSSGERFPLKFLRVYSFRGKLYELARLAARRVALFDPLVLLTLYKADEIVTVTGGTKNIFPAFARQKAIITPVYITVDPEAFDDFSMPITRSEDTLRLLYIGRVMEWKGIALALFALKNLKGRINYEFTLMGEGPGKAYYEAYAWKHQLDVNFVSPVGIPRRSLSAYYRNHDLFVFPGLHGTGSYVMLEAHLHQLPVLTLDMSIPESFAPYNFDWVISTEGKSIEEIVASIEEVLLTLYRQKQPASGMEALEVRSKKVES